MPNTAKASAAPDIKIILTAKDQALLSELSEEMHLKPETVISRALKSLRTARNNEKLLVWQEAPEEAGK